MRFPSILCAAALFAGGAHAQHSLLFCLDSDDVTLNNAGGLVTAGLIQQDEVAVVTPNPVLPYSASAFLSVDAQWAYLGDEDQDGRIVDSSSDGPGQDTDALFIKRFIGAPTGPVGPRDVFVSKEAVDGLATGSEDSDVFRYATQLGREVLLLEADIKVAINGGSTALDLDAICQTTTGDLFLSFAGTKTVSGISTNDGDVIFIPSSAITYDAQGNVTAITASSAVPVLSEANVNALIAASACAPPSAARLRPPSTRRRSRSTRTAAPSSRRSSPG